MSKTESAKDTFIKLGDDILILNQIDLTTKVILAQLKRLSHKNEYAFASDAYLSKSLGVSKSKISRSLRELEELSLIERKTRFLNDYDSKKQRRIFVHDSKLKEMSAVSQKQREDQRRTRQGQFDSSTNLKDDSGDTFEHIDSPDDTYNKELIDKEKIKKIDKEKISEIENEKEYRSDNLSFDKKKYVDPESMIPEDFINRKYKSIVELPKDRQVEFYIELLKRAKDYKFDSTFKEVSQSSIEEALGMIDFISDYINNINFIKGCNKMIELTGYDLDVYLYDY